MDNLLETIKSPDDIKKLNTQQMQQLAREIREFLISSVSKTGGHLASNLGVVELTLALHKVFNTPEDKIIWDVGHQSYVHKIITGRKDEFSTLRKAGGIAGFPKTAESIYDTFNTGHSSTSISAALGMARARDLKKENYSVVAVIGDGALTGGMAFEAMNDAGRSPNNIIVVLNDNEMSISKNVGGMSRNLSRIRTAPLYYKVKEDVNVILSRIPAIGESTAKVLDKAKSALKYIMVPGIIFEELGFKYLGPIDGHDIEELSDVLSRAKQTKGPVLVHVCTKKGKGYAFAEKNPLAFHGISPFDVKTGQVLENGKTSYSDIFGKELVRLAHEDESIVAITAAMPNGTGLSPFSREFPNRFFDVGIAEQHAVTLAAGLAISGLKPVVAIYSTFLQRAYDQILHDVALQNLHVVFAVDRAGIVGEDGETHQGLYDISFLRHIPNMSILTPCDNNELAEMLEYALKKHKGPIAIRYPRGSGKACLCDTLSESIKYGQGLLVKEGKDCTVVALGDMVETALNAAEMLEKSGVTCDIINARWAKPIDIKLIAASAEKTGRVVVLENNTLAGGFGSGLLEEFNRVDFKVPVKLLGFPDKFIEHGSREYLFKEYKLDAESVKNEILKLLER